MTLKQRDYWLLELKRSLGKGHPGTVWAFPEGRRSGYTAMPYSTERRKNGTPRNAWMVSRWDSYTGEYSQVFHGTKQECLNYQVTMVEGVQAVTIERDGGMVTLWV